MLIMPKQPQLLSSEAQRYKVDITTQFIYGYSDLLL